MILCPHESVSVYLSYVYTHTFQDLHLHTKRYITPVLHIHDTMMLKYDNMGKVTFLLQGLTSLLSQFQYTCPLFILLHMCTPFQDLDFHTMYDLQNIFLYPSLKDIPNKMQNKNGIIPLLQTHKILCKSYSQWHLSLIPTQSYQHKIFHFLKS